VLPPPAIVKPIQLWTGLAVIIFYHYDRYRYSYYDRYHYSYYDRYRFSYYDRYHYSYYNITPIFE
jgi:hypothetical protein